MGTRADLIFDVLHENKGRLKVSDIRKKVAKVENVSLSELNASIIPATVRQENKRQAARGRAKRFNIYGDGTEQRGYISIYAAKATTSIKDVLDNPEIGISRVIEEANKKTREQVREALQKLHWREFEANFLPLILESLGFHEIQVTQLTRDGGLDATCLYRRGLVKSEVIVSAKHWNPKQSVPVQEVQRLRGLRGNADTAIIITTAKFTSDAIDEAAPSQNQRAVVLIDGETIVDTCFEREIGVSGVEIPKFFAFEGFSKGFELDEPTTEDI